jgi:hypothetical protein
MKKETTIAILFGIILGGILAVFIIAKNKESQMAKNKTIAPASKLTPAPSVAVLDYQQLEISEPLDGVIVDKNTVKIKGKTDKDALIIIQSQVKDMIFKNTKVDFNVDFPLALGENTIKVVVYPKDSQVRSQEKELKVYYLDEQI